LVRAPRHGRFKSPSQFAGIFVVILQNFVRDWRLVGVLC